MSFYSEKELKNLGFKSIGSNVLISNKSSFYGIERIEIGDNVRIDDFSVLSAGEGGIKIGSYIHIAVFTSLIGAGRITLNDFCNISSKVSIYSSNDDYSGESLTNPMVSNEYTNVTSAPVTLQKHVIIGSGAILLPNVHIGTGCAIGALSLVNQNCEDFGIYTGVPAKKTKQRSTTLMQLEEDFLSSLNNSHQT